MRRGTRSRLTIASRADIVGRIRPHGAVEWGNPREDKSAACGVPGSQEGRMIWNALIRTIFEPTGGLPGHRDPFDRVLHRPGGRAQSPGRVGRPGLRSLRRRADLVKCSLWAHLSVRLGFREPLPTSSHDPILASYHGNGIESVANLGSCDCCYSN